MSHKIRETIWKKVIRWEVVLELSQKNKSCYVKVVVWAQDCLQWQGFDTSSILTLGFCYQGFIAPQLYWCNLDQLFMNCTHLIRW